MEVFLVLAINIAFILFAFKISSKKAFFKKVFIRGYVLLWAFWLTLSSFNIFNLYNVSLYSYFLIYLGNFSLIFGLSVFQKTYCKKSKINYQKSSKKSYKNILSLIINLLLILCSLYLMFLALKYYKIVAEIGAVAARLDRFKIGKLFTNTFSILFYNTIISGLVNILTMFMAKCIINKKIFNFKFLLSSVIFVLYMMIGSGRLPILYLGCFMLVFFAIKVYQERNKLNFNEDKCNYNYKVKTSKIVKKVLESLKIYLILILIGVLIFTIYLSSLRVGADFGIFSAIESIIVYNIGSFRALDYGILNIIPETGFMFGRMTLSAIDEIIGYCVRLFGFNYNFASRVQSVFTQITFPIGNSTSFNALFSWHFWFYWDFGVLGVILFPFIIGAIVSKILSKLNFEKSISQIILCYIAYMLVFSPQKWVFLTISDIFPLLVLLIYFVIKKVLKVKRSNVIYLGDKNERIFSERYHNHL